MARRNQTKADGSTMGTIPPKYQRALSMLIAGSTVKEAAESVGLHRQQLSKAINQNVHVKAAYMQLKADAAAQIGDGMRAIVEKSIKIIAAALDDEEAPPEMKFNAAMTIISRFAGADIVKAVQPCTAREIVYAAEQKKIAAVFTESFAPPEEIITGALAADWRDLEDESSGAA